MIEKSALYVRIASSFTPHFSIHFTTLGHFFRHLYRLYHCIPLKYVLTPRLIPCNYRVLRLFAGHQSCHCVYGRHDLTLDPYGSSHPSDKGNVYHSSNLTSKSNPLYQSKPTNHIKPTIHIKPTVYIKPKIHIKPIVHIKPTACIKPPVHMKATSYITPTVNIKPTVPSRPSDYTHLLPSFSLQFLPLMFCYISGVDFTYHHYFYHSVDIRIASIIPLIQLLVASFHLKCIFLFCRCDLSLSHPFDSIVKVIQEAFRYGIYILMNSFRINLVHVLVVIDLVYIYSLLRYPPIHCSLLHPIQCFQALCSSYLLSSIHIPLVCSPLKTYRLYPSLLTSVRL